MPRHQAARSLLRFPMSTSVSVLTMAVGLGASVAVLALVDAVVLRPLPYPQPEQLVRIFDMNQASGVEKSGIATGEVFEWRRAARGFAGIAGYYEMGRTVGVGDTAYPVIAANVTEDFFAVAGVQPALGRLYTPDDHERATYSSAMMPNGSDPVVIASHGFWRSRLGGDPAAVGRTVLIERMPFRLVGVMPPGFALPSTNADLWLPWRVDAKSPRDQRYLGSVARLAPGVALGDGEREINRIAAELARTYPTGNTGWQARLVPLHEDVVGGAARILWFLLGGVTLLVVVTCANVALATLTRGLDRAGEAALRLALGASPGRLVREFVAESLLQAFVAGVLGLGIAAMALQAVPRVVPDLPRVDEVTLSVRTLLLTFVVTALSGLLTGALQAWRRARVDPAIALTDSSRRLTAGSSHGSLRHAMTVAQVALAVVLLTGAGLLTRSVQHLASADVGFTPAGVLVAPTFLDTQGYQNGDQVRTYYRGLFEQLRALPSVASVGGSTTVPTSPLGPDFARPVWRSDVDRTQQVPAAVRVVTAGYAETVGLRMKAGRAFDDRDGPTGPRVVVVSEGLARQLWPGESAIGKQLTVDYSSAGTYPYEIIGVVGDVRFRGPRSTPEREIYLSHAQRPYLILNVVVKTTGDANQLVPDVLRVMREMDPLKPPQDVRPLTDLLRDTYARDRLTLLTLATFAGMATLLAMLSVYGVLSHLVESRRRDIAVRMAMGADMRDLLGWIAEIGGRVIVTGLVLGVAVGQLAGRSIGTLLYGVAATDVLTTLMVLSSVLAVGAMATLVPWYRATRVAPLDLLRRE
ncbi:MAG: ABC transporter permease [Vicinamibacterales bacterium]